MLGVFWNPHDEQILKLPLGFYFDEDLEKVKKLVWQNKDGILYYELINWFLRGGLHIFCKAFDIQLK